MCIEYIREVLTTDIACMGPLSVHVPRRSGHWGAWPLNGKIISAHFVRYFVPALSHMKIFVNGTRQD